MYLQIFLADYRRRNRPYLIIHHAQTHDLSALCLFINMSEEPVHVQCVMADIQTESGVHTHYVTEYQRITPEDRDVQSRLRQGPIQPGGYLTLGSFEDLLLGRGDEEKTDDPRSRLKDIQHLRIKIAVVHGPSRHSVGASRNFTIQREGDEISIAPESITTRQWFKRKERKAVNQWIESTVRPREAHQ